ncbi:oligosaccharide flippase family protein [Halosquirtibacter xylanolyticus]|uniref:oligosaccharide flippase family protein n=1 Tax=Halosquirtibacter xylanolyticus TaxID=3374599 RepID=UPI0037487800|nr:oligosaccharide flippase family protein [Prolixibacteraceae bacterium]
MILKFRNISEEFRSIVKNFSYLSILQVVNMLLPMLLYGYLLRVLGNELFGKIIYIRSIVFIFGSLVKYGFDPYGAREVAYHRDNIDQVYEITVSIITGKLFLGIIATILYYCFVTYFCPNEWSSLYWLSFLMIFQDLFFPRWFYMGIEDMKYITYIMGGLKIVTTCLIFFTVSIKSDYLYIPLINGVGAFISGLFSCLLVFHKLNKSYQFPSFNLVKVHLVKSASIFLSEVMIVARDNFNVVFIGMMLSSSDVTFYDLCNKLINLSKVPFSMFNDAIYPTLVHSRSQNKFWFYFKWGIIAMLLVVLVLNLFSHQVISLFLGDHSSEIINLLHLNSLIIPFNIFSMMLGTFLLVFGYYNKYSISVVSSVLVYLFGLLLCVIKVMPTTLISIVMISISASVFEMIVRAFFVRNKPKLVNKTRL